MVHVKLEEVRFIMNDLVSGKYRSSGDILWMSAHLIIPILLVVGIVSCSPVPS